MDIIALLTEIEDRHADTYEETRDQAIAELSALHAQVAEDAPDNIDRFLVLSADSLGGIYLPYLFWYKLGEFYDDNKDARIYLQKLIEIFSESSFEEEEQKKIKPLLVAYLSKEKEFEVDKIRTIIIDKAHATVKDYFHRLFQFVQKNQKATEMYCEKFTLLREYQPNFELLSLPITKLKEILK